MRYKIVMDSAGEFTEDMKGKADLQLVPLTLYIGDEALVDDGTIDQLELVRKIAAAPECPKTACPSPQDYLEAFECDSEHIYGITISGNLSGSFQSAQIGMNMFLEDHPDAHIHVFDSCSTSGGETVIALKIIELEEAGLPFDEIVEQVEAYVKAKRTYFTLDNLDTLRKNGRLSRMKALAATVLKIKPICIGTVDGIIEQVDQARGNNKAMVKLVEHVVKDAVDPENRVLAITYVNCFDRACMVRDALLSRIKVKRCIVQKTGGLSTVYANDGGIIVVI